MFKLSPGIFTNWLGKCENTRPKCAERGEAAGHQAANKMGLTHAGERGLLHILRDLAELRLPSPALFEGSVRIACA